MIFFECPGCSKQIKVKDELAGRKVKCPGCGTPIPVRAASVSLAVTVPESGKASPAPTPGAAGDGKRTLAPLENAEAKTLALDASLVL